MKTLKFAPAIMIVLSLITLTQLSCTEETNIESIKSGDFGIFLTKNQIGYDSSIDYSQIKLDTIEFEETPFLTLEDIESYDTVNHVINLSKSKNDLTFPSPYVFGQMFVVVVDNEPLYCGFFWSIMSSIPCNWIYIEDPNELNGISENQIQINAGYPDSSHFHGNDPRKNPIIYNLLSELGKLTGEAKIVGQGLNFHLVIKSKNDTSGLRLQTPINALDLEKKPFIAYDEIQSYDTTNHVLELTINHDAIKNRINNYVGQFVVSLDDKRQYSGLLIPTTSSMIYSTITIIEPYYDLDSLKSNQIKISLGYPNDTYFDGEDLRLTNNIIDRLKHDNKAK
jgi:hypothetical protein